MPRPLSLYPERQRCRKCRRYFGFTVILRQWCSEECAGIEYNLATAPRSCKVRDRSSGAWRWKQVWWTEWSVQRACKAKGAGGWYRCDGCWGYHLSKFSQERYAQILAQRANP